MIIATQNNKSLILQDFYVYFNPWFFHDSQLTNSSLVFFPHIILDHHLYQ